MSNVIIKLGFWLIRIYLRIFESEKIIKIKKEKTNFKLGELIVASDKDRDLYYLGDDFYFVRKPRNEINKNCKKDQ